MGSIFTAMVSTAEAMRTMQRSLSVVENNILNASTVGYARQQMNMVANPYNPNTGSSSGGVSAGPMQSSRNAFVEASVWKVQHRTGYSGGLSAKLTELERSFPLTAGAGITGQLDRFFGAVSQWSIAPNDSVARRQVLDRAGALAQSFNQTALELGDASSRAGSELTTTVQQINRLTESITGINRQRRENFSNANDAGLDSSLHAQLEELARYINFTALPQEDGSVSIFAAGQTPLVIGDHHWNLALGNANGKVQIIDPSGMDITSRIGEGKLGGLLEYRNNLVPDYQARLNTLAEGLASNVNTVIAAGIDQNGNPPVNALFSYNTTVGAAFTLSVTSIAPSELTAAAVGDPGGNTNALNLVDLQTTGIFSGLTPNEFYAGITSSVGDRLNAEKSNRDLQDQLLLQAQNVRTELSGVDINTEATKLLQLQKGFEAAGQVMTVLNSMTETIMTMMR